MTKKKQRARLARALRRQGIKGARSFKVAKLILRHGAPALVPSVEAVALQLWIEPGHFCPFRFKHKPTQVWCEETGACVQAAWREFCSA